MLHTSCLKTHHQFCSSALVRIFSNWGSLGKDVSCVQISWKEIVLKTWLFFYCFDSDLAKWRRVGGMSGKRELYNAKKFFWLWKFVFHISIWQHKTTWSSLQNENRWNCCAVCWALESVAKIIWAYIRFGSYLSVMRPESSNSDKKKSCVTSIPKRRCHPNKWYMKMNPLFLFSLNLFIFPKLLRAKYCYSVLNATTREKRNGWRNNYLIYLQLG